MASPTGTYYQGYAEGEYVLASSQIGGVLQTRTAQRGDHVKAGNVLFSFDLTDAQAARDQAAAALNSAESKFANLTKGKRTPEIASIGAQKDQAEAQLQLADIELARQEKLAGTGAASSDDLDRARANDNQLKSRVNELSADLQVARIPLGREDEIKSAENDVTAAKSALASAQWRLDQETGIAPADAMVTDTYFNPGETVGANQPVVSLLPPGNIKVRFFVPQEKLSEMKIGTKVSLRCDGCGPDIPATVRFISPQSEYTPPVLYNRENRDRIVFMLEAWPTATPEALHPGQPVDVTVAPHA